MVGALIAHVRLSEPSQPSNARCPIIETRLYRLQHIVCWLTFAGFGRHPSPWALRSGLTATLSLYVLSDTILILAHRTKGGPNR
ncbi:hypothetical protein KL86PLE_10072 [uncultured Pleomorphomonas sp.]|uniref:Uncharacterized protein n=1 Tax=uncultured Pleomorphomonas sp. TaxID=442121 RepID=A0A212KY17_9HYPH|nr:hypothetical protein KL86PLE_10072 [uncultured Pleomorphomonas sp.]